MKAKQPDPSESFEYRAEAYMRSGEQAAMYFYGLADAFEQCGGSKDMIYRIREQAHELNMGTLYVRHGYGQPPRKASSDEQ